VLEPKPASIWSRLPSIVWVFIFIGGIVGLIGGIIGLFWLLSNVEGAASVIMLLVAWGVIRGMSYAGVQDKGAKQGFMTAIGVTFFALMGMAIDQPGNYLYNKPMEVFFCPDQTELHRGVSVTNPVPGQTNVSQEFSCVSTDTGVFVKGISTGRIILVRFFEYLAVGYILIYLNKLYMWLRFRPEPNPV
jgi:hypothetical protein